MCMVDVALAFNAPKVLSRLLHQLVVKSKCETGSAWREAKVALALAASTTFSNPGISSE